MGADDLRVIVMHGGGSDHKVHILPNILRPVAQRHGNPPLDQGFQVGAVIHVRTGDHDPHAAEHLRQRGHGHAAYADQMTLAAGRKIVGKFCHINAPKEKYLSLHGPGKFLAGLLLMLQRRNDKMVPAA